MQPKSSDARSIRSSKSRDDAASFMSEDTEGPHGSGSVAPEAAADWEQHATARSNLAARAKAQLEQAAQQEKDRARARELEEQRYLAGGEDDSGLIPGLEVSDESEGEDDTQALRFNRLSTQLTPSTPQTDEDGQDVLVPSDSSNSPYVSQASKFPLPSSADSMHTTFSSSGLGPSNGLASSHRSALTSAAQAAAAAGAVGAGVTAAVTHNGRHSPSPSVSSRKSRKSMEVPPVPPVPSGPTLQRMGSDDATPTAETSQRRMSFSRRSSNASLKRKTSFGNAKSAAEAETLKQEAKAAAANGRRPSTDSARSLKADNDRTGHRGSISSLSRSSVAAIPNENFTASAIRRMSSSNSPTDSALPPPISVPSSAMDSDNEPRGSAIILRKSSTADIRDAPTPQPRAESVIPPSPRDGGYTTATSVPGTPMTSIDHSRPNSEQLSAGQRGTSLATIDTSPRSSLQSKSTQSDPRQWNVDQVVEWARSKNYDPVTISKFQGQLHTCPDFGQTD